jgi:hypothetical protein
MANPAAWKMFIQNIAHRKSEVCGCLIVLQSHVIQQSTSKSERSFFPIQQCRSSWWSLIKLFPERSHYLGHGLSRVLSLMHSHTCHQALLYRVTACFSHCENTTKFCWCGKSRMYTILDTVANLPFYIVLRAVLCCAVPCCVNLNWVRCVLAGCTVTFRPTCTSVGPSMDRRI